MRLFVAIELANDVRGALERSQEKLRVRFPKVKWVRPTLMHVTLKFLGDVPDTDTHEVCEVMRAAALEANPFGFTVGACGCFPRSGAVRTIWAGVAEPTGTLSQLAQRASEAYADLGYRAEQRFSPHVTLGRVRDGGSDGALREAIDTVHLSPMEQSVESIVMMSSVLRPQGPEYGVVDRAPLGDVDQRYSK